MNYIDLEDDFPTEDGTYTVKVVGSEPREAKAIWINSEGFSLIDDALANDEYIESWIPI